ncbi:MAG: efflux RND transporter periplasmic adaptor subunit [Chitinophagaceae bacterium]
MTKTHINLLLSLIISVTILSCGEKKAETTETETKTEKKVAADEVTLTTEQYNVAAIQLGKVEMRNLSNTIKVSGEIDVPPQNLVSISAPLGGYIKSAGLLPGEAVRKGQVIAVIQNPEFIDIQQDYLESKSRLVFLSQDLKRQQELRREEINSAKALQQVSSEYNMLRAKMNALEQKLSLLGISSRSVSSGRISKTANLYSPITGYVTASNINMGKYVQPSDVLFELANKNDMHLALNVFEKDVRLLKVGQTIRFALSNEGSYAREAKVFLIGKSTEEGGTIPVHCHLNYSSDPTLFPGMYVKALIETTSDNVPALPIEAIVQSEGKDFIFIQTDTAQNKFTFKMVPVVKGTEQEGLVAVTLFVNFDMTKSKIVVKGAYALLSAMKNVGDE